MIPPIRIAPAPAPAPAAADTPLDNPPRWIDAQYDFGVIPDGVTDNTAALQAAINEACASYRKLILPPGDMLCGALTIPGTIRMEGAGSGDFAYGGMPASSISRLLYAGAPAPMITIAQASAGGSIEGLVLECGGIATTGLRMRSVLGMKVSDLYMHNFTGSGLLLDPDPALVANCMFNEFHRVHVCSNQPGSIGVHLTGSGAACNTCHNVFSMTRIEFGGAGSYGLIVGHSDNNVLIQTYIFTAGTGVRGVYLKNEYGGFPISTEFHHLQASVLGYEQDEHANDNFIFGYAQDNAQPDPITNGGRLFCVSTNGGAFPSRSIGGLGTKPGSNVAGIQPIALGATTATVNFEWPAEPDRNYAIQLTPTWFTRFAITSKSTTGFTVALDTPAPGGANVHWAIARTG